MLRIIFWIYRGCFIQLINMQCCKKVKQSRDYRQTLALLWRIKTVLKRDPASWFSIFLFPLVMCTTILTSVFTYNPAEFMLTATGNSPRSPYVTSTTPNATDNNFFDKDSGFNTHLNLRPCTLYKSSLIGLVKNYTETEEAKQGNAVLDSIFDEINGAFTTQSEMGLTLQQKDFETWDYMADYVTTKSYREDQLCFYLGWETFEPTQNKFVIDIGLNFGDMYETRQPQTFYENSIFCDYFLSQQGDSGFLQAMTTVASKVISDVYKIPTYNFQLMYMPMNTGYFRNDFYWDVLASLLPIVYLGIVRLSDIMIKQTGDITNEPIIQQSLKRIGMRKSVELYRHGILTLLLSLVLFPPIVVMTCVYVFGDQALSISYFFLIVIIFVLNSIAQQHMITFACSERWAYRVNKIIELVSIIFMVQGIVARKMVPWYVYMTSVLPLNFISWYVRLGMRAYNRNVQLEPSSVALYIDLQTILNIGICSLIFKVAFIAYCWPVEISGTLSQQNSFFYMCKKSFWRECCSRSTTEDDQASEIESDSPEETAESQISFFSLNNNQVDPNAFLSQVSNDDPNDDLNNILLESERKMIENGDYQGLRAKKDGMKSLKLENIVKKVGDKVLIDDLSVTIFNDEIFVLIGENGAGKSTILQSIAGNYEGLEGTMNAHGFDIKSGIRLLDDFIAFQNQEPVTMSLLTVEEHIEFYCRFRGIASRKAIIDQILADFDLKSCSNIVAERVSQNQKKKLNVALALLGNSKIILLDEPTAGLDIVNKRQIWERIIKSKEDKIIIIATQDMQEAEILADRIGLMHKGQLQKVGSPQFFKKFYDAASSLVFTFKDDEQHRLRETELRETILNSIKPKYRDKVTFRWNSLDQLVFKMPSHLTWQQINKFVDMDALISRQYDLFETIQLKKPSLAEAFEFDTYSSDRFNTIESPTYDRTSIQSYSQTVPSWKRSFKAQLHTDFRRSIIWRQIGKFTLIFSLTIIQEVFFLIIQMNIPQKTLNYSDVSTIFDSPIQTVANRLTPTLIDTYPLFKQYDDQQPQVELAMDWRLPFDFSRNKVNNTLTRVANMMNHTVVYNDTVVTSNFTDVQLGAYYVYYMDESQNDYSIAIYGRQYAAAALPTYGATMLQTLTQKITNQNDLSLEFRNRPLPINNPSFPSIKTSVSEFFGITMLTAATLLMVEQIKDHGRPIESGFYHSQLIRGGFTSTYFLSKYLKNVLFNMLLYIVFSLIRNCFRMEMSGSQLILILWVFINPFFVFLVSHFFTLYLRQRHQIAQKFIVNISGFLGVVVFLRSGIVAFGYNQVTTIDYLLNIWMIFPTNAMVGAVQWGFLFRRYQIWINYSQELVSLKPWEVWGSYIYNYLFSMLGCLLFYALMTAFLVKQFSFRGRRNPRRVTPFKEDEADDLRMSKDVKLERNNALRASSAMQISKDVKLERYNAARAGSAIGLNQILDQTAQSSEYAIVVNELQCWKTLQKRDIGRQNQHSVIQDQGWGKLGVYSVKGVSFCVRHGENFVILGSASSGRTSMLQNITGLERVLTGDIKIDGLSAKELYKDVKNVHGIIGYQPQTSNIDIDLSVSEHITLIANLAGTDKSTIATRVQNMLVNLYLEDVKDDKAGVLSPGYLRRLTLGMALIGSPKIVILDDPTAGVDPVTTQKLLRTIRLETRESTLLVCTQSVDVAEALAEKIAVMHEGKFIAVGTPSEFMYQHGKGYTVEMQISLPLLESTLIPQLDSKYFGLFIEDENQAILLLGILQKHLHDIGKVNAFEFVDEFSSDGAFKPYLDNILLGIEIPLQKFVKDILIQNITKTVTDDLKMRYGIGVQLNSIQGSQVRIGIETRETIQRQDFSDFMDQLVRDLPIQYFTLQETTLDQIFSKLIQNGKQTFLDSDISYMRPSIIGISQFIKTQEEINLETEKIECHFD